jgi:uncharacterized protein Yka (UPF0111/DUF47 family)
MRAMCRNLAQARVPVKGVGKLRRTRDYPDISGCVDIHTQENEADKIEQHALAALFDKGHDPTDIIKWKDIYEDLEAPSTVEDAANVLETLS